MKDKFSFKAKVWLWPGFASWHFVYVNQKVVNKILKLNKDKKIKTSANGLIPIIAKIGKTEWQTSLLPHKKEKTYLIAIKSKVRKTEGIYDGSEIKIIFRFY
jgi:hypothetical protein